VEIKKNKRMAMRAKIGGLEALLEMPLHNHQGSIKDDHLQQNLQLDHQEGLRPSRGKIRSLSSKKELETRMARYSTDLNSNMTRQKEAQRKCGS